MQFLVNLGIRKKLYLIFGIIIFCAVCGIILGQVTLVRIQVGGETYSNIVQEIETSHNVARLLLTISLSRGRVAIFMAEADPQRKQAHVEVITRQSADIDGLFSQISSDVRELGLSDVAGLLEKAQGLWSGIKETRDGTVIPLLLKGEAAKAREVAAETQSRKFEDLSGVTDEIDRKVRAHVGEAVASMKREAKIIRSVYIGGGLLFIVFLLVAERFLSSMIVSPIIEVSQQSQRMASGDFQSGSETIARRDEVGLMLNDFRAMSSRMGEVVGTLKSGIMNLSSASEELSATAEDLSRGTWDQSSRSSEVVRAISEMSNTIVDVAKNAAQAADATKDSSATASGGKDVVVQMTAAMNSVAQVVGDAVATIRELDRSAIQIGEIVNVISDIADQTNLLALNAAIEAARAGEQGRGFAIVADEVRKLADRTARATGDIRERIGTIQTEAEKSVVVMDKGSDEVRKGMQVAEQARASLDSIVGSSTTVVDMVERIAVAAEEQSAAAEEINRNMEAMAALYAHSTEASENIRQAAHNLAKLAAEIQSNMEWFKVEARRA